MGAFTQCCGPDHEGRGENRGILKRKPLPKEEGLHHCLPGLFMTYYWAKTGSRMCAFPLKTAGVLADAGLLAHRCAFRWIPLPPRWDGSCFIPLPERGAEQLLGLERMLSRSERRVSPGWIRAVSGVVVVEARGLILPQLEGCRVGEPPDGCSCRQQHRAQRVAHCQMGILESESLDLGHFIWAHAKLKPDPATHLESTRLVGGAARGVLPRPI